jgi:peptidoglycan hydrolase-like protein with peptidoglycan-binding domain
MTSTFDAASTLNKPELKEGSKGDAVKELEKLLDHHGVYSGAIDGIFGPAVTKAVKSFQHKVFLLVDGNVGSKTWRALYSGAPVDMPALKKGSKGDLVKTVQKILFSTKDYKGAIDGDFGPGMETAVKAFQVRLKLSGDGVVGNRTWFELSKIPH